MTHRVPAFMSDSFEASSARERWAVRVSPTERSGLERLLGVSLPTEPLRAYDSTNGSALWLGPDEWLVLMPPEAGTAFRERYASTDRNLLPPCSIVDVTHRNAGIVLRGASAAWVLNAGCPLDLSSPAFPPGTCTRTLYGKAEIILWRREEPTAAYHIECWRSFLPYVWSRLQLAAAEYVAGHSE